MSSAGSFEYQVHKEANLELNLSENNDYANYGGGGNDYSSYGNSNANYTSNFTQMDSASIIPAFPSRNEDLKSMLESNKDGPKVEAMKRLIAMIAKGRASSDTAARELFPHVVKNVVTKNAELKKLVYLYLTRYAEQEQDLALLSISSFQRSLKDPNPLIRASALRVLSSIRVPMISPIMLIAIKDCSNDMSAYVRKTAAHAISKLYHLDPDLKEEIISIIERLLQDKTSLVLGSAVAAFEEICPDRFDLIHSNYRKFVSLMPDFDEWGQVILINMLIRYGRTQFLDPNRQEMDELRNEDESNDISGLTNLDPDHRLLLRNAKPLLQSRNSAVVMAVVQLFLALAPDLELNTLIVKPLIRLLHSHPEIQIIVLSNIVTLTGACRPGIAKSKTMKPLFEPYLKSFFIKSRDSTQVKILKLSILTNLSSSSNIPLILREFQAYIHNYQADMEFVSATIQAIGRCASRIREVAPVCLNGLISLLSNRNESIVAQSIIVIRTQIIRKEKEKETDKEYTEESKEGEDDDEDDVENSIDSSTKADSIVTMIIKQVIRLIDKIETPHARATILWILAEFCDKNDKSLQVSPDVLRMIAKTFCNESNLVKLQAMNLASKLYLMVIINECDAFNEKEKIRIKALINYVFNLAKYDVNYDVRDRGRFLRQLMNKCDSEEGKQLTKRILMSPKVSIQSEQSESFVEYSSKFRIGTLSHFLDKKVNGYEELPDFPTEQPDTSVRQKQSVEEASQSTQFELIKKGASKQDENSFFTDSSYSDYDEDEDDDDEEEEEEEDDDEDEDEDEEVTDSEEEDVDDEYDTESGQETDEESDENLEVDEESDGEEEEDDDSGEDRESNEEGGDKVVKRGKKVDTNGDKNELIKKSTTAAKNDDVETVKKEMEKLKITGNGKENRFSDNHS